MIRSRDIPPSTALTPDQLLFQQLCRITTAPNAVNQEAGTRDVTIVATLVFKAVQNSLQHEIPDYMRFVLQTSGLTIIALPWQTCIQDQFVGKYVEESHQLQLAIPNDIKKCEELIQVIIPREFWRAYQAVLRVDGHHLNFSFAESEKTEQESSADLLKAPPVMAATNAAAPFHHEAESKAFAAAITQGNNRILMEYRQLRERAVIDESVQLDELTTAEKITLIWYGKVTREYRPQFYRVLVEGSENAQKKVQLIHECNFGTAKLCMGGYVLYGASYAEVPAGLQLNGHLVIFPQLNKPRALFEDTFYRVQSLESLQ